MGRDTNHYQYDSYTTGRKQDYGHHELNEENGWICFEWNRGDYTETMEMKKPLEGKGWKPFRVYTYASTFEDFLTIEEAQAYFDERTKLNFGYAHFVEVDKETGKKVKDIAIYQPAEQPKSEPEPKIPELDLREFISFLANVLDKEKKHLDRLKRYENLDGVASMISRSSSMVEHLTTRLSEYREYAIKHYGKANGI